MILFCIRSNTFFKNGFNLAYLQASENVPEEFNRLHNSAICVVNKFAPSFRNIAERSLIPEALVSLKFLNFLNTLIKF